MRHRILWRSLKHHYASPCITMHQLQFRTATACHSSRYYTRAPTVRTTGWASTTSPGHGGGGGFSSTSRSWAQRSTEQTTTTVQATVPQATLPPWLETYTPTGPMRTEMTLSTSSREDAEDAWFKNCRKDSHPAGCECILWLVIRHVWRMKWKWQALEPWFIKLLQEMNVHYGYKGLQDPNDINIIGISGISICYRHQFPLIFDTVHLSIACCFVPRQCKCHQRLAHSDLHCEHLCRIWAAICGAKLEIFMSTPHLTSANGDRSPRMRIPAAKTM